MERELIFSVVHLYLFQILICLLCLQREMKLETITKSLYATPSTEEITSNAVNLPLYIMGDIFSATLCPPAD